MFYLYAQRYDEIFDGQSSALDTPLAWERTSRIAETRAFPRRWCGVYSRHREGSWGAPCVEGVSSIRVTCGVDLFINTIISFLIVAFAMFLVIRGMNRMKKKGQVELLLDSG
jgi:hypothetical protein